MKIAAPITYLCCFVATATFASNNPFGIFDLDFRGTTPEEQIMSIEGIGFDGVAVKLARPDDLEKLERYLAVKPDLKVFAGYVHLNATGGNYEELVKRVVDALAPLDAQLWLIVGGDKTNEVAITQTIQNIADLAARKQVQVSIYPHDNTAIESAEEALVYLKRANRANVSLTVHSCHELRHGNLKRIDEVIKAVQPHISLVTISGGYANRVNENHRDWSDAIKPLNEGDLDLRPMLQALDGSGYNGPIIVHNFGLQKKPASHHQDSFNTYQALRAELKQKEPMNGSSLRVSMSEEYPVPASEVWALIAGFDTLPDYHASITSSELLEGGAVRKIGLTEDAGGGFVVERLVNFDDEAMTFSYRIIDLIDCDFPLRDYQAFVRVEALGEKACRLHWGSKFAVEGVAESEGDALAKAIYQGCFDGVRKRVTAED